MKTFENRPNRVDAASIDRLVDGELPEPERRDLLLDLEADPDGWRRCALAFLEDQAWRTALASPPSAQARPRPISESPVVGRPGWSRRGRASIAASLVAATFAAGFAAGGMSRPVPRAESAKATLSKASGALAAIPPGPIREVGSLQIADDSAGEAAPPRYPIRSGPGLDDRWLRDQPPSVPDYLKARWERLGFQVAERRDLVSVEFEDGRRVSVPVDEIQVQYVGQQPL